MKYAIVPINFKQLGNHLYIRCVLISFSTTNGLIYGGTRFLDKSPYFKDESKALQYSFFDDGYILTKDNHGQSIFLMGNKRPYHFHLPSFISVETLKVDGYEFTSDEEAINFFRNSDVYDCDTKPLEVF